MSDVTLILIEDLLKHAKSFGATDADAVLSDSTSLSVTRRLGKQETLSRSEESEIGLRVLVGKKQAVVSSSDKSPQGLKDMAERAVAMAKAVPEDAYAGIADASELATSFPELDLFDPAMLTAQQMNDMADTAEAAAMEIKGITNSEGADCGFGHEISYYLATNGFAQSYQSSSFSLSVSVIAGEGTAMERDYDYDYATHLSDLKNPALLGKNAAERAVRALNPRKGSTKKVPVIFENRRAGGLIGTLSGAISGSAVARGTTMLKDKMGEQIFGKHITIIDDPHLKRGHRSRPFDGEGVAPQKRNIIENGKLTGWLLDLSSARQLKLKTTGNAARGASGTPHPSPANFYMLPGNKTPEEMIAEIDEGFFVTSLMGSGGDIVTGDYSRGASGFWIEKGKIAYPVSGMTIAGNLKDMWMNVTPANDLIHRHGIDTPTLLIDGMIVAGT